MARTVVEEFVALLGWEVDAKELDQFQESAEKVVSTITNIATVAAAATATILGTTGAMNLHTAEVTRLADAVGIEAETLEALGGVVREIGFDFENVADLVEEMNNKIGESAGIEQMSSVKDSVKILGLEFEELRKMKPEDQFLTILDAAKELEDQQQAVSAVDMLFGGEANKFLGLLRTYDMSLSDIIERQKELNLLSDEGRQGALAFAFAFNELRTVGTSLFAEFSGLLGEALVPIVKSITDWVLINEDLVKTKVIAFVQGFTRFLTIAFDATRWFIEKVDKFVDSLGGLELILKTITLLVGSFIAVMAVTKILAFVTAIEAAGGAMVLLGNAAATATAKAAGIALFAAAIFLLVEDIKTFLDGGDSLVGRLNDKIQPAFETAADSVFNFISEITGISFDELQLKFVRISERIGEFFTEDLPAFADDWFFFWFGLFEKLINISKFAWKLIFMDVDELKVLFKDVATSISTFFFDSIDKIVVKFQWLLGKIKGLVNDAKSFLPDFAQDFLSPSPAGSGASNVNNDSKVNNVSIINNNTVNASGNAIEGAAAAVSTLSNAAAQAARNLKSQIVY